MKSQSKINFGNTVMALEYLDGIKVTPEYRFCKKREFRADYLIEYKKQKILIEYEGIFCKKSRHSTVSGYSKDTEKYNLATVLGYPILRYTAKNYKNVTRDILMMLGINL